MSFASCKQTLFPLQSTYHTIEPCSTACPKRKETYATINQIRFLFVFSLSMYVLYITYVGKTLTCKKANPFPPPPRHVFFYDTFLWKYLGTSGPKRRLASNNKAFLNPEPCEEVLLSLLGCRCSCCAALMAWKAKALLLLYVPQPPCTHQPPAFIPTRVNYPSLPSQSSAIFGFSSLFSPFPNGRE